MAIAARRPAPPPPTISTSWAARTSPSLTSELLVEQDPPVVVHDQVVDAPVVELLAVALAAAGEGDVLRDEALQVLGDGPLAVVQAPARCEGRGKAADGCSHRTSTGRTSS